jgi:hypothetical protein
VSELDLGTLRGHVDLDVAAFDRKYGQVQTNLKRLSSTQIPDLVVDVDATNVFTAVDRVDTAVQGIPDGNVTVGADTAGALGDLSKVGAEARALPDGELEVTADTSGARGSLNDLSGAAKAGAAQAGDEAGSNLAGGILAALATIPVAGAIVGIGAAIGDAMLDGLQNEVRSDRLAAMTDLSPEQVALVGRAAGEAYANNFGESIASNMDVARVAIQAGLLDPNATARDTQAVIEQVTGVADLLGEDVPRVARSAAQAIKTGMAGDAAGAFDILVRAQKAGLNVSEDLLDTVDEYSTQFRKLGLEGPQAFGLIAQAVRAGARDTDIGADALKEFSIRAVDGSVLTQQSFEAIGASASDMAARIAAGGPDAAAALDETLDKLRAVEDPAKRAQIAVGLFGTQAEDLGDALYAMDLTSAVDQLGAVEGAAKTALQTLGDNSAGQIETAERNIATAADGIKGALAAAFAPQIEGFSTFVTTNREAVMTFLLNAANGALDFGRAVVEGIAAGTEAVGGFIAGPAADLIQSVADTIDSFNILGGILGQKLGPSADALHDVADGMRGADDAASGIADTIRTNLIGNGLDPAQQRLNDFAMPLVTQAALHDAMTSVASGLDGVGYAADGAKLNLAGVDLANLTASESGRVLDEQLRAVATGLDAQTSAGTRAGDSQAVLSQRYEEGRQALVNQLQQMGLTQGQAEALARAYGAVPGKVDTTFNAYTDAAQTQVDNFIARNQGKVIRLTAEVSASGNPVYVTATGAKFEGRGDVIQYMAEGGVVPRPLDRSAATLVAPGDLRVMVGDRKDVRELFAPLDRSARTHQLMAQGAREMGALYLPMADGALLGTTSAPGPARAGADAPVSVVVPDEVHLAARSVRELADAILAGARDVSAQALASAVRAAAGSRSTPGVVR